MRIDHVGYAVHDIETATPSFLSLGYRLCEAETEDRERGVKILFLSNPGGAKIELVAPLGENSPVSAWLKKNGNSPYHICYESDNIAADVVELKNKGFISVKPPLPAPALRGRQVAFLYGKHTGLIELAETDKSNDTEMSCT